jgi:hypothetical protein
VKLVVRVRLLPTAAVEAALRDTLISVDLAFRVPAGHRHGRGSRTGRQPVLNDDLVRDVTKILTSPCARPYSRSAAADRARRARAAVSGAAP